MDWPEGDEALSTEAVDCVEILLCLDPAERAKSASLKTHSFFTPLIRGCSSSNRSSNSSGSTSSGAEWSRLLSVTPPFVPTLDGEADTTYFEPRNNMQHLKLSEIDIHGL